MSDILVWHKIYICYFCCAFCWSQHHPPHCLPCPNLGKRWQSDLLPWWSRDSEEWNQSCKSTTASEWTFNWLLLWWVNWLETCSLPQHVWSLPAVPSAWKKITTPHRVCGRKSASASCEGITYTTGSEQYGQVCGRIIGYQIGTPDSFAFTSRSIDSYYLDGVSVTHGSSRQHIWSFSAGFDESSNSGLACPCVTGSTSGNRIPSFVGQNYFCETGITQWNNRYIFYPNGDPLWDGQGCGSNSTCCTFNSPPWFNVQLSSPTTDDIEVRICGDEGIGNEDTPIQLIELYVK